LVSLKDFDALQGKFVFYVYYPGFSVAGYLKAPGLVKAGYITKKRVQIEQCL